MKDLFKDLNRRIKQKKLYQFVSNSFGIHLIVTDIWQTDDRVGQAT